MVSHRWLSGWALAVLASVPLLSLAQATASRQEVCTGGSREGSCAASATITVSFAVPAADAGKPGAFYIGARATRGAPGDVANLNADTLGMWLLTASGWVAFNGAMYTPLEAVSAMPATKSFAVVEPADLCQRVGDVGIELWAGYGVLQADKQAALASYYPIAAPNVPVDHLRAVFVYNDMKDAGKYLNVLNARACGGASGSSSGDYGRD